MKKGLLIGILFFSQVLICQTIDKFSIDSGGEIISNGGLEVLYAVGEVYVQEATLSIVQVSGGFINPIEEMSLSNKGFELLSGISLYPNPTKDLLYFKGDLSKLKSIDVYSAIGQHIINIKESLKEINISKLESAIYFIKFSTDEASKTFRIIKE